MEERELKHILYALNCVYTKTFANQLFLALLKSIKSDCSLVPSLNIVDVNPLAQIHSLMD